MASVLLVDTTVFLNVLNVPGFNQSHRVVIADLEQHLSDESVTLLLPMAAIFETGNHVAQLADGNQRRRFARIFTDQVGKALNGEAPWRPTQIPDADTIATWLGEFPEHAMRRIGMGDLSIIKTWGATCEIHPHHRVRIWSLDNQLLAYDREP